MGETNFCPTMTKKAKEGTRFSTPSMPCDRSLNNCQNKPNYHTRALPQNVLWHTMNSSERKSTAEKSGEKV